MKQISKTLFLTLGMAFALSSCSEANYSYTTTKGGATTGTTSTYTPAGGSTTSSTSSSSEDTIVETSESDTKSEDDGTSTTEVTTPEHSFADFRYAIDNSKPTKVNTIVSYYLPGDEVTLNFQSTMLIEYGTEVRAIYTYSYEKLNPIGSKEFISTITGTIYYTGNIAGISDGNSINWNINVEGSSSILSLNFVKSYFSSFEIDENSFVGSLDNSKVTSFFNKNYGVSNVDMTIIANKDFSNVSRLGLQFTSKEGASVYANCYYSYNEERVDF